MAATFQFDGCFVKRMKQEGSQSIAYAVGPYLFSQKTKNLLGFFAKKEDEKCSKVRMALYNSKNIFIGFLPDWLTKQDEIIIYTTKLLIGSKTTKAYLLK